MEQEKRYYDRYGRELLEGDGVILFSELFDNVFDNIFTFRKNTEQWYVYSANGLEQDSFNEKDAFRVSGVHLHLKENHDSFEGDRGSFLIFDIDYTEIIKVDKDDFSTDTVVYNFVKEKLQSCKPFYFPTNNIVIHTEDTRSIKCGVNSHIGWEYCNDLSFYDPKFTTLKNVNNNEIITVHTVTLFNIFIGNLSHLVTA
jgi:hypothetical protein